jgi:tRNA (cytidine/uridine-2'-O-)-methyltransferase
VPSHTALKAGPDPHRDPAGFRFALAGGINPAPKPRNALRFFDLPISMRIALYQPDIPQNTGTILRLCACFGVEAHIIEPSGFPTTDRAFRRAGMDYLDAVTIVRHRAWSDFAGWRRQEGHRLIVFTTAATLSYLNFRYQPDDILLFGRESAGLPAEVHDAADARLRIPIRAGLRSLNVAVAAALAAGEALRQTGGMPG